MSKKEYQKKQEIELLTRLLKDNKILIDLLSNNFSNIFLKINFETNENIKNDFHNKFELFIKFLNQIEK